MIILSCETSTLLGSVAVLEDDHVLSSVESLRKNSHSDSLNIFIEQALLKSKKKLSDVDLFVTGIGPGSFTGIRISLNTIKTFGYCYNKPVLGINSLHSLALQVLHSSESEFINYPIIPMINAYKNMIYVATYKYDNKTLVETKKPEVVRVQNLSSYICDKSIVCGDGYLAYQKYFSEVEYKKMMRFKDISDEPHAITAGLQAFRCKNLMHGWQQLVPLYLRASEAEENLKGIKYQPLI